MRRRANASALVAEGCAFALGRRQPRPERDPGGVPEPAENTDPDRYPEPFRLTPQQLSDLAVTPSVPLLRPSTPDTYRRLVTWPARGDEFPGRPPSHPS